MAQKQFSITQKVKVNGQIKYSSARITCDEDQIEALVASLKLEGEVTIMEEKVKSGNPDTNVTAYNQLGNISMTNGELKAGMYPSKAGFIVSNTLSPDEIVTACKVLHPYTLDSVKKPDRVYARLSGGDTNITQ